MSGLWQEARRAHHVMRQLALLAHIDPKVAEATSRDDRVFLNRIFLQPLHQIGLHLDRALLIHLRGLGLDDDHAGIESKILRLQLLDLAS